MGRVGSQRGAGQMFRRSCVKNHGGNVGQVTGVESLLAMGTADARVAIL